MTKKDYVKIAGVLKDFRAHLIERNKGNVLLTDSYMSELVFLFSSMLKEDNPLFDRERFHKAIRS